MQNHIGRRYREKSSREMTDTGKFLSLSSVCLSSVSTNCKLKFMAIVYYLE